MKFIFCFSSQISDTGQSTGDICSCYANDVLFLRIISKKAVTEEIPYPRLCAVVSLVSFSHEAGREAFFKMIMLFLAIVISRAS